ncbi:hypothetical protein HUE87_05600 [Candidatus Sulfurimonas marisnigri]|uniref:Uncharacterized protein n=1 Tax=Candidatus Sulfurimonas marisnigri TaxID=2740405 RepID=A0A7S7M355_9BACT|nr:hypothetical protein [Candidatus Sulfurimonas marisnigri]QOY55699.1 hypothetical protein HUE87_05600 [Candidatus Sulfurimonas marisnigri]
MIKFDKKAMEKFNQIPDDMKAKILSNVYCSSCKDTVKIIDFTATISREDLLLKGKCEKCGTEVARLVEI